MAMQQVEFQFFTGIKRSLFANARLSGSWDVNGRWSTQWTVTPMIEKVGEDGCPTFFAAVSLDLSDHDKTFRWGVILDGPQGSNIWGIPTEIQDVNSTQCYREFRLASLSGSIQTERFYFTYLRRLGANKWFKQTGAKPELNFAVWAPHAKHVNVVFGKPTSGYIADDGQGVDSQIPKVALKRTSSGIWEGRPDGDYDKFLSRPYMYEVRNAQDKLVYRTDIFSRSQSGKGHINPAKGGSPTTPETLDGTVSCSVVIDPDVVRRRFESAPAGQVPDLISAEEFWAKEFTSGRPVPSRVEDLVIYELHIGSLGFGHAGPGTLQDAIDFLDHLVRLGVNAVELLPMAEFSGNAAWGYGDTHHLCIEASAGGRDKYRHFVRECHRRGIAVLQDVVYNHYDGEAERAEWQYDSIAPEQNIYYWYEGKPSDYSAPDGGFLDNGSTGFTPRFWEEIVRQQFISAAAFLIEEMHVDGLRVDLTQAIHRDNTLHGGDHRSISSANVFGQKLLREWSRTLHMIRPTAMLVAEDHTGWDSVTKLPAQGGLGFDATWQVQFYHNLIGDSDMAGDSARLLKRAGFGGDEPIDIARFSGLLYDSQYKRVIFHESHDEAGNAGGTARTISVAVNGAALVGETRRWAEARSRLVFGLSLLSAGTPMFFMGEETGAAKLYKYNSFLASREDIVGLREGEGKSLFRYYQDLITLGKRLRSIRSQNIDILHHSNSNRVIAFKRWSGDEQIIIVASFNDRSFNDGYVIEKDALGIPSAGWKEVFNSDAAVYGGHNVGNYGSIVGSTPGRLTVVVPAVGFVVFVKQ